MFTSTTPYEKSLGDNLILKSISREDEIDRLAQFNATIHGLEDARLTATLIRHHPLTHPDHWLTIEDQTTGQIVSSLCLIPWRWRCEDVELRAGEMGFVGTLPEYRGRGLIRELVSRFKELLHEGEYDLSHIQGIPYFYRQFGYEYAIPLQWGQRVELHQTPPVEDEPFKFRQATSDDIPVLMHLHDEAACDLEISAIRSEEIWRYILRYGPEGDTAREYWLVIDQEGRTVGFVGIELFGFTEGLNVCETSRLSHAASMASLRLFKRLAQQRNKPYIRLNIPGNSVLMQAARACSAHDLGTYAWQIHLPDVPRLLRKLSPVFERRIAASPFAGLTQTVLFNLYREAVELHFETGKLVSIEGAAGLLQDQINVPPMQFIPLVLGYWSREELAAMYPDVRVEDGAKHLTDVLFPKVESFIYTAY